MKLRNRMLAVLLTLAMVLSMLPVAFAAEQATVTLISPAGSKQVTVTVGGEYTFPAAEEYEGYQFSCWTTEPVKATDGSDVDYFYFEGETLQIDEDRTFYALYGYIDSVLDEPCFYWTDNLDDYTGEYALVGYDADFDAERFVYEYPLVMGETGEIVDVVNDLGATVDVDNAEFFTADTGIVFFFEKQSNGSYTIQNLKTEKYLSVSNNAMAFVSTPDSYSYWNIVLDAGNYEYIFNAKNSDLVLLYDYVDCQFALFDNSKTYLDDGYPADWFYVNMHARETAIYMFTTEIENGTVVDPTEPTEPKPTDPTEPTEPTEPEPLPEGYVAIYNVASSVVMTTESSVYNNKEQFLPAAATLNGDKLSVASDKVALFEMITDAEGNVSFRTEDGKYLEADGTNLRFVDAANENTLFVLEEAEGGYCLRLANYIYVDGNGNEKAQYIEYYASKEVFTVYSMGANLDLYVFDFYEVESVQEPTEPTEPTEPDQPEDPEETVKPIEGCVAIYNVANSKIMTTEANVYNNKEQLLPGDATLKDGKLSTTNANVAQFYMTTDAEGITTFQLSDGRYLEADGTNLRFVEAANENTQFVLEPTVGGYYIRLANYLHVDTSGNEKAQYIEYYTSKEVFTTFGMGKDYTMFVFDFYPLEGDTTPDEPKDCEHEWDEGVITVEPTCSTVGEITYTCALCGETKTEELEKLPCASGDFTDLNPEYWYHEGVDFMLNNGFMNGMGEGLFLPNASLNRAMVATVLYRIAGEPEVEGTTEFTDVPENAWYTKAVIWAQSKGIVTGYTDGTFQPNKSITRQEMALMLARYAKLNGIELTDGADLSVYPDADSVAAWAEEAVAWCVANGIINGVQSEGVSSLKPGNNATRAQFASIIMRYLTME